MSEYWRDHAACLGTWQELFFPVGNGPDALRQTEQAKAVCRGCPVIEPCLTWALDAGVDGVWGALPEDERRALRKRTQRAQAKARDRAGEGRKPLRQYTTRGNVVSAPGTRRVS